jgi:hypothetical protein
MKFNTTTLTSNIKGYFTKAIGAMLIIGMIWQGSVLGVGPAFAAGGLNGNVTTSLLASSSMSKQVSKKMDEAKDKVESVMKDGKSLLKAICVKPRNRSKAMPTKQRHL